MGGGCSTVSLNACFRRKKYNELQERLRPRVNLEEDSVRFYPLSKHTLPQVEVWGGLPLTEPPSSTII